MSKQKIVIASVLKPVNDTRMFEKFGLSGSQTNKYEINIIGFLPKKYYPSPNISFYPLFNFSRLSLKRLFAPFQYFIQLIKINPVLIIITTPELLLASCLYKSIFKAKLIYDIQENYKYNILYNQAFPALIKIPLAFLARKIETLTSNYISYFFLAEASYKDEIPFVKDRHVVLANKYKEIHVEPAGVKNPEIIHFIYTGTIAKVYGIFEAIHFIKAIYKYQKNIKFTIAGFCAENKVLQQVKNEIFGFTYINLVGGGNLVPHEEIIKLIKTADFALAPYHLENSIKNKIPTKFYEYLANKVPVIIPAHKPWVQFCEEYNAAIPVDFTSFSPEAIISKLNTSSFFNKPEVTPLLWESEKDKFLQVINQLTQF